MEEDLEEGLDDLLEELATARVSHSGGWLGTFRNILRVTEVRGRRQELKRVVGIVTLPLERERRLRISLRPMMRWFQALPRMAIWERLRVQRRAGGQRHSSEEERLLN